MNGLHTSLYTAALTLCLFSAGLLGARERRAGRSLDYFTIFLGVEAFGFALEVLMAHPATPLKSLWLGLRLSTALLMAPVLWLAVREIVEGARPAFASLGRTQLTLMAAGFLCVTPLIARAHFGLDYVDPANLTSAWHSRLIHGGMLACIGIFVWQVPFYLGRCRRLLVIQADAESSTGVDGSPSSRAWLHLPLVIVATTWVFGVLRVVQCITHADASLLVLGAFVEVSIVVGSIYLIVRHAALGNTASPILVENVSVSAPPPTHSSSSESKYARARLDPEVRARIRRKLETAMTSGALYADSLLSLRKLCAELKENAHAVSQVINQDLQSNFYELVNRHRIERAKQFLRESPDKTVLEIALEVGFNSKSTFNTAFRRYVGMTPTEFRASNAPAS